MPAPITTDAALRNYVRQHGFPDDLCDSEIDLAIYDAVSDLQDEHPLQTAGTFPLVVGQQVYDVFNAVPVPATAQGALPDGWRALEVLWSPDCLDGDTLSVFGLAPLLQDGVGTLLPTPFSFRFYGDWWIYDATWAAFRERFGRTHFEHVTDQKGSPLRLVPTPTSTGTAFCRYTMSRTDAQIRSEDNHYLLQLLLGYCGSIMARKFTCVAGTKVGELANQGLQARYWQAYADAQFKAAWEDFHRLVYATESPVARS